MVCKLAGCFFLYNNTGWMFNIAHACTCCQLQAAWGLWLASCMCLGLSCDSTGCFMWSPVLGMSAYNCSHGSSRFSGGQQKYRNPLEGLAWNQHSTYLIALCKQFKKPDEFQGLGKEDLPLTRGDAILTL